MMKRQKTLHIDPDTPVVTRFTEMDDMIAAELQQRFIAFDVETTGLNTHTERIVELGAVLFVNGIPTAEFSSLVNPGVPMPELASQITGITNDMLQAAPDEAAVYPQLLAFLGDAADCRTIICAHNARFDLDFLRHTLTRLGYHGDFRYIDTLKQARQYLPGMPNYKQPTLAQCLNIAAGNAHRAADDALVCGRLMTHILAARAKSSK